MVLVSQPDQAFDQVVGENTAASSPLLPFQRKLVGLARQDLNFVGVLFGQIGCSGLRAADLAAGQLAGPAGIGDDQGLHVLVE